MARSRTVATGRLLRPQLSVKRRNTALAAIIALVATVTAQHLAPGTASASERDGGCVDDMTWSYNDNRLTARFEIDLPSCWRSGNDYNVKAWIERSEATSPGPERVVVKRSCDPTRVCRVRVKMGHPSIEATPYRASIQYLATPDGVVISHRILTCVSAREIAHCEHA